MISEIIKQLGYRYLETKRKRTTDRFVLCKGKEGFFYIKVDERELEGYSNSHEIETMYRSMIKKQTKDVKMFDTLIALRSHIDIL